MTDAYLPPGRPGDARWNAPGRGPQDSPKQARLRRHARRATWWVMAFGVLLAVFASADLLEIRAIHDSPHPTVRTARGVVDVYKASHRRPVFRLTRPGAEPLLFECLRRVAGCPAASQDWAARELTVEWITLPTLMPEYANARPTRLVAGDDVLFAASPRTIQEAEVADIHDTLRGSGRLFGGFILAWMLVAAVLWTWLGLVTRQIEAAHRRAEARSG